MDRQEWLERRRKGIGGTDAGAILGLSKYRTAIDVWEEKTGRAAPVKENAAMQWGLRLEDAIAAAYCEETGRRVRKTPLRRHPENPILIGSPDRLVLADIRYGPTKLLEIKTARSDDEYAPRGAELDVEPAKRIPARHYVQVQHYLGLLGLEEADVAVLFGGSDFRIYPIPVDPEFVIDLFEELDDWWTRYVVADVQPPVGPDDAAFLSRKYPSSTEEEVIATSEIAMTVAELLEIRSRLEELEAKRDGLENTIKDYMGEAGRLIAPGASITWRSNERKVVGWKEVAAAYRVILRELVEQLEKAIPGMEPMIAKHLPVDALDSVEGLYTHSATIRPFRITRNKEA